MEDKLHITIQLDEDNFNDEASLQKAISKAIMEHQDSFLPLLERLIDLGDARVTVIEGSLNIEDCDIDITSTDGVACGSFDSHYYDGCKDRNAYSDHEVNLPFTIEDNKLYFDIELPPAWRPGEND